MQSSAPPWHRLTNALVAVFLLGQIAVPASYYLTGGADERFAWRMFSTRHVHQQIVAGHASITLEERMATDDGVAERHTPIEKLLPKWWVRLVEAQRTAVIEKLLRDAERKPHVLAARLRIFLPRSSSAEAFTVAAVLDDETGQVRFEDQP